MEGIFSNSRKRRHYTSRSGCRFFEKSAGFQVAGKKSFNSFPQRAIAGADLIQIRSALAGRQLEHCTKDGYFPLARFIHEQFTQFLLFNARCEGKRDKKNKSIARFFRSGIRALTEILPSYSSLDS